MRWMRIHLKFREPSNGLIRGKESDGESEVEGVEGRQLHSAGSVHFTHFTPFQGIWTAFGRLQLGDDNWNAHGINHDGGGQNHITATAIATASMTATIATTTRTRQATTIQTANRGTRTKRQNMKFICMQHVANEANKQRGLPGTMRRMSDVCNVSHVACAAQFTVPLNADDSCRPKNMQLTKQDWPVRQMLLLLPGLHNCNMNEKQNYKCK